MRREIILQVAYEKFSKKGYNTSLSEIAKEAGIKKQTIYNYYENKDELFFEMIEKEVDSYFNERIKEIQNLNDGTPEEQLKTAFFSIVDYFSDIPKLMFWRWLLLIDSRDLFERTQSRIQHYESEVAIGMRSCVANLLGDKKKEEEFATPIIQSFMSLLHGTLDGILLYHDVFDMKKYTENVWFVFWTGVECLISREVGE